jgi:phenylpropionate dioxygenase-like ring-hydroxylating dioxygenase large terminal subunit
LFFGRNEEDGLRCVYHGWKFDVSGACIDGVAATHDLRRARVDKYAIAAAVHLENHGV